MKIIICGCNGKMGNSLINLINKSSKHEIIAGVDKCGNSTHNFKVFSCIENINLKADVIIDFSHPSALCSILNYCKKNCIPSVICTTGLLPNHINEIKKASQIIPLFYSRNMSMGVNLIKSLACRAAEFLGENFDIEIIEKHHNQKIDAPSGTALMLAEEISKVKEKTQLVFNRTNTRSSRSKNEIGISCVRAGNICGDHEIIFAGENEIVTLTHHAQSRDIFSAGALRAAEFILNKTPKIYTMDDLLSK